MGQSRTNVVDPMLASWGRSKAEQAGLGRFLSGHPGGVTPLWRFGMSLLVGFVLLIFLMFAVFLAAVISVVFEAPTVRLALGIVGSVLFVLLARLLIRPLFTPRRWWIGLYDEGLVLVHSRRRWDAVLRWPDLVRVVHVLEVPGQTTGRLVLRTAHGRRRNRTFGNQTNDVATLGARAVQLHNERGLPRH